MGDFNLSSLHNYVQLQVEGPTQPAAADPVASSAGSANPILLLATGPTVSGLGPSRLGGDTAQWAGFRSVSTTNRKGTFSLKVLVARIKRTDLIRFILMQLTNNKYIRNGSYSKAAIYFCSCQ